MVINGREGVSALPFLKTACSLVISLKFTGMGWIVIVIDTEQTYGYTLYTINYAGENP